MLAADRVIFGVAEQMLGAGRVQIPHGIRGNLLHPAVRRPAAA